MDPDDFWRQYEHIYRGFQDKWYTGTWQTGREPTEKEEILLGLCLGDLYNRFPELELWNYYNRIRLSEENKNKIVDFLKRVYEYYKLKYKDWQPYKFKK